MSDTKIDYADKVWNPVTGCTEKSRGCANCFAEREWPRKAANPNLPKYMGRKFTDVRYHYHTLWDPLKWKTPQIVMVESMGDLFHEKIPFNFISEVFTSMRSAPQHTYLITTKRPERMLAWYESLPKPIARDAAKTFVQDHPHIWLGVSVEDQDTANERIPLLLNMPAALRWLSVEPMLGPLKLGRWFDVVPRGALRMFPLAHTAGIATPLLDWVVCGGESGPKARPMHPDWPRSLRDQCQVAGVPFFFKQWGEWKPISEMPEAEYSRYFVSNKIAADPYDQAACDEAYGKRCTVRTCAIGYDGELDHWQSVDGHCSFQTFRIGKHSAGHLLDGREWHEFPSRIPQTALPTSEDLDRVAEEQRTKEATGEERTN